LRTLHHYGLFTGGQVTWHTALGRTLTDSAQLASPEFIKDVLTQTARTSHFPEDHTVRTLSYVFSEVAGALTKPTRNNQVKTLVTEPANASLVEAVDAPVEDHSTALVASVGILPDEITRKQLFDVNEPLKAKTLPEVRRGRGRPRLPDEMLKKPRREQAAPLPSTGESSASAATSNAAPPKDGVSEQKTRKVPQRSLFDNEEITAMLVRNDIPDMFALLERSKKGPYGLDASNGELTRFQKLCKALRINDQVHSNKFSKTVKVSSTADAGFNDELSWMAKTGQFLGCS